MYIVGGGGGGYKYRSHPSGNPVSGGGGGYAKLLKGLALSGAVAVTIGSAGQNGTNNTLTGSGSNAVTAKDGGATKFGGYGTANGGKCTNSELIGGDGGCGGAGAGGSIGGVDGGDGSAGINKSGNAGTAGKGGGNTSYCPTNPYDGQWYGIGGNTFVSTMSNYNSGMKITFPILNNNPGRGGMGFYEETWAEYDTYPALSGVCIVYGTPLK